MGPAAGTGDLRRPGGGLVAGTPSSWSAGQLTDFLAAVTGPQESGAAIRVAIERAAESLGAEVAALVRGEAVVASIGLPPDRTPEAELAAAAGTSECLADLPSLGPCSLASASLAGGERLLVVRDGGDRFSREEIQLLRGMARVLGLTLSSLRLLERERHAQRQLALSERHTRQILETAHDAFVAIDSDGRITDWNPPAEATFAWAREDVLGRELAEIVIPERYREAHRRGIAHFLASGEGPALGQRLDLTALHRDGYEFPIELTISALQTEDGYSFNAFLRDISERKRREGYLDAQQRTAVVLAEAERVSEAVPRLLEAIGEPMGWEFGAMWMLSGGTLQCEVSWMAPDSGLAAFDDASKRLRLAPGVGLAGRVFKRVRPEFVEDVRVDANFPRAPTAKEVGLTAGVALPLCVRHEVLGVIEFFSRGGRYPEPEMIEMMEALTALIGRFFTIVSEREELRGRLESLALTDELTALPNRRAWERGLGRELSRAERAGDGLCVALVDLDHFKRYNDEHGHPAGDALLREAAARWGACLRASDLLARLGGDEFALAFPAQSLDGALAVIERLRALTPGSITSSAGLAPWLPGESAHALISRADAALYEAKRTGGDKALAADELPAPAA